MASERQSEDQVCVSLGAPKEEQGTQANNTAAKPKEKAATTATGRKKRLTKAQIAAQNQNASEVSLTENQVSQ